MQDPQPRRDDANRASEKRREGPRFSRLGATLALLTGLAATAGASEPWRLRDSAGAPDWFRFRGEYRLRYETLDGQFAADRYVGHQSELRIRWDVLPGNLRLEAGGARLFAGGFTRNAPNVAGQGDATYGYVQMFVWF